MSVADLAVLAPPGRERAPGRTVAGVFDAAGRPVPDSIHWRGLNADICPVGPAPEPNAKVEGCWLFGGYIFGHFGHFLTEGISRLWAIGQTDHLAGVLFLPSRSGFGPGTESWGEAWRPALAALGADLPVRVITEPTCVERVVVPQQALGLGRWIEGAEVLRRFLRSHVAREGDPPAQGRLYLSRSGLQSRRGGGVLMETRIERLLQAQGYAIYHPQRDTIARQIEVYRTAHEVISIDASPLHLLALAAPRGIRVAIIARRPGRDADDIARQLRAFADARVTQVRAIRHTWMLPDHTKPGPFSWAELDLGQVGQALLAAGYITDTRGWDEPTGDDLQADVAAIGLRQGGALRRLEPSNPGNPP